MRTGTRKGHLHNKLTCNQIRALPHFFLRHRSESGKEGRKKNLPVAAAAAVVLPPVAAAGCSMDWILLLQDPHQQWWQRRETRRRFLLHLHHPN